jgi:hypothetical protein
MKRTLTALYETREQAERVRDQLVAAGLGDHVTIRDQDAAEAKDHRDVFEWIGGLFGGHDDSHLYAEGLRRGHVLVTVEVEEAGENRATELLEAGHPVDLDHAERTWRPENWKPRPVPTATWSEAEHKKQGTPDALASDAQTYSHVDSDGARPKDAPVEGHQTVRVRIYALYE